MIDELLVTCGDQKPPDWLTWDECERLNTERERTVPSTKPFATEAEGAITSVRRPTSFVPDGCIPISTHSLSWAIILLLAARLDVASQSHLSVVCGERIM